MPYQGSLQFPSISKDSTHIPTTSLRAASLKTKRDKIKCNCTSTCRRGRCSCRLGGQECSNHCHPKNSSCLNKDLVLMKVEHSVNKKSVKSSEVKSKKRRKIVPKSLSITEEIQTNCCLQDSPIEAANRFLKNQFRSQAGLYNPVHGQDFSFPITRDAFIQILLVGGNHWVTVAGVSSSLVHVYDSVYNHVHDDVKIQVAALMLSDEPVVTFKLHKVQFQKGSRDCGLYAVAYATDLAYGNDPSSYRYKQEKLRSHFIDCIKKEILTPFPRDIAITGKPSLENVPIYCSCRLPDNGEERMVRCSRCGEWYHQSCERIPPKVFQKSDVLWECSKCI